MFSEADPAFIVAMSAAIPRWPGSQIERSRILRIHGAKDLTIPCPADADFVIANAGHLVAYTHPQECVGLIVAAHNA